MKSRQSQKIQIGSDRSQWHVRQEGRVQQYQHEILKLDCVYFIGVTFIDTNLNQAVLSNADMTDAIFLYVQFNRALTCDLTGNQSGIFDCSSIQIALTDSIYLSGIHVTAMPETDDLTLPAKKIIITVLEQP